MSAMILGESMCSEYFCRMSKRDGSLIKQRSWSLAITLLRNHPLTVIGSGKSLTSWLQFCFLIISLEKRGKNKSWETLPAKRDLISCESGAGFVCKWLLQLKGERRHQFRQLAEQKISAFHFDSIAWMWAGGLGRETRDKLLAGKCECQQCLWVNGAGKKTIFCQSRATRREERGVTATLSTHLWHRQDNSNNNNNNNNNNNWGQGHHQTQACCSAIPNVMLRLQTFRPG